MRYLIIYLLLAPLLIIGSKTNGDFSLAKKFLNNIVEARYDSAYSMIDPAFQKKYSSGLIYFQWQAVKEEGGLFKRCDSTWVDSFLNKVTINQLLQFEKARVVLRTNVKRGSIIGFAFAPFNSVKYTLPVYASGQYEEIKVKMQCKNGWELPGILTVPKSTKKSEKFPIVVLVHGSGASNLDEEIGPNKPFKDLALGLAAKKIASFRYSKRTFVYSDEMYLDKDSVTISDETIEDAISATQLVKYFSTIDSTRVFVLGHSLGGMCVPYILSENNKIKGAILMAAPAQPLTTTLIRQLEYISALDSSNAKQKFMINTIKYQVSVLNSDTFSLKTKSIFLPMGLPAKYWISLKSLHQVDAVKECKKPMLVLQGDRDYQVTLDDFKLWRGSISNGTFRNYSKLNHLFLEGEGKCKPSEYETPSHVAFYVIEDIASWIKTMP